VSVLVRIIGPFGVVVALGAWAVNDGSAAPHRTQSALPVLRPGSLELTGSHLQNRCDTIWYRSRDLGDTTDHVILAQRQEEVLPTLRGKSAVLIITRTTSSIDSAAIYREGLTPIWETSRNAQRVKQFAYEGGYVRVRLNNANGSPILREHWYGLPVFNFVELDALIRSIPLRAGYAALLPLYSEGDDSLEVDTVRVVGVDSRGAWRIRFADPAIVATFEVHGATRQETSYSHVFRKNASAWKAGTKWLRTSSACRRSGWRTDKRSP
jgi:hypothetical protein